MPASIPVCSGYPCAVGYFSSIACFSLKLSGVSAGSVISLLPVNAAPAVPAPAPLMAPIAAPLPPPASANQGAGACAAADECRRALAFAFDRASDHAGGNWRFFTLDRHRVELHLQQRSALEVAHRLGVNHAATRRRALFDHGFAVCHNRLRHGRRKSLAGLAVLGAQSLSQPDGNDRAFGNNDGLANRFLGFGLLVGSAGSAAAVRGIGIVGRARRSAFLVAAQRETQRKQYYNMQYTNRFHLEPPVISKRPQEYSRL